jgi:probable F420-dependent oxidoreductase
MKFGVSGGPFTPSNSGDPSDLVRLAQAAEQLDYDSFWTGDHVVMPYVFDREPHEREVGGRPRITASSPVFEPLSALCFLAGQTRSIRLGTAVLVVPYRNPVLAAKALAMVDIFSGGRLSVGVGTGWMREEFAALDAGPYTDRGRITDEYLTVYRSLWTEADPVFAGKYCAIQGISLLPKPAQKPHPPIWVGGNGRASMRRAIRFGHGWMPLYQSPAALAAKARTLRQLSEEMGREPRELKIAVGARCVFVADASSSACERGAMTGTPQQVIDDVRRYEDAGVDEIHLYPTTESDGTVVALQDVVGFWSRFADDVRSAL